MKVDEKFKSKRGDKPTVKYPEDKDNFKHNRKRRRNDKRSWEEV